MEKITIWSKNYEKKRIEDVVRVTLYPSGDLEVIYWHKNEEGLKTFKTEEMFRKGSFKTFEVD